MPNHNKLQPADCAEFMEINLAAQPMSIGDTSEPTKDAKRDACYRPPIALASTGASAFAVLFAGELQPRRIEVHWNATQTLSLKNGRHILFPWKTGCLAKIFANINFAFRERDVGGPRGNWTVPQHPYWKKDFSKVFSGRCGGLCSQWNGLYDHAWIEVNRKLHQEQQSPNMFLIAYLQMFFGKTVLDIKPM